MAVNKQNATAVKRLLRDLKEVLEHPLPNVVACPLEDDIFVWHGNVRGGSDSAFTDTPFHFKLIFPQTYPIIAPTVSMFTRLPHPNITKQSGRPRWRLAIWDCSPTENGWSCAYTVHSILLQLQAFLIADDMMWQTSQGTLESAIEQAASLTIEGHSHSGQDPYPPFPSEEALALAAERNRKRRVSIPIAAQKRAPTTLKPQFLQASGGDLGASLQSAAKKKVPVDGQATKKAAPASPKAKPEAIKAMEAKAEVQGELWQVVRKKGKENAKAANTAKKAGGKAAPSGKNKKGEVQPASSGKDKVQATPAETSKTNPFAALAPAKKPQSLSKDKVAPDSNLAAAKPCDGKPSKSAKKNAKRSKQRAEKSQPKPSKDSAQIEAASAISSNSAPQAPTPPPAQDSTPALSNSQLPASSNEEQSESWSAVPVKERAPVEKPDDRPIAELIQEVKKVAAEAHEEHCCLVGSTWSSSGGQEMGGFSQVPLDIMTTIFSLLDRKDIAMLGSTCRGLRAVCGEGEVWRLLLQRDFSGSQITASKTSDWKSAYLLQSHNIVGELQCYFSKASFEDQVLGMPAQFTVNPRTGIIDYIQVHPELLSLAAFKQGVTSTVIKSEGGDIQIVIPAYLNEDHFQRALPSLPGILRKLTLGISGNAVGPAYWLDACSKMMNTAVVLLMDKGIEASQKAISSYCSVHRFLLALADHYNLWDEASRRLDAFLSNESNRAKVHVPNLGWLITLLTISPKHKWGHLAVPLLMETLDRNVLWSCKEKESLVQHYSIPEHTGGVDEELLQGVYETSRVALGLLAFHSAFLHFIARPPGVALDKVMEQSDVLYGRPSEGQVKRMQNAVARIESLSSWEQQLQVLGVKPEGNPDLKVFMTKVLRRAWRRSLAKGYHSRDTDFRRIHASGVSKILLKGQSYTTPPNMKGLEVADIWRWQGDFVNYLDSSMILYGKEGLISTVDWMERSSFGTKIAGAVSHSGDLLDMEEDKGMQTMSVVFADLGDHVTDMYFVASAFAGLRLADFKQPHILIRDSTVNMTLCEYHLGDNLASVEADSSCVVMCRFVKSSTGRWTVQMVGDYLPVGYAGDGLYQPILDHIETHRQISMAE